MSTTTTTSTSPPQIPLPYRLLLTTLEPLLALGGALNATLDPSSFLSTIAPQVPYVPASRVVFDQLASCYLLFAFNEAVVLRATRELRVWSVMVAGMLVCDVAHLAAEARVYEVRELVDCRTWGKGEWVNLGMLWGCVWVRVAFLMGVGFQREGKGKRG
ncbi:hypothetical protein BS50DRAFT_497176 [Corynespora cassiicola Philippines]|uniref:DUF7704 domain-containing protein n=1 Tax=Corynespora cassiicola Philippines TaxID=1448308 RepID=A0A2T2NJZ9_CORCC|nr:hypothetical protein BS50DRAFT_497176 [Corynespora cassiicola Philippines]